MVRKIKAKVWYKGLYKESEKGSSGYYATIHYPWKSESSKKGSGRDAVLNLFYIRTKIFDTRRACDKAIKDILEKLGLEKIEEQNDGID